MVGYLEFRKKLLPEGCFSVHQAMVFLPSFDRNNLTRWARKGMLVKLRQSQETIKNSSFASDLGRRPGEV